MSKKWTLVILLVVVGMLLTLVGGASARQEKPKFVPDQRTAAPAMPSGSP